MLTCGDLLWSAAFRQTGQITVSGNFSQTHVNRRKYLWEVVSLKRDGTPNCHCVNDKEYSEDESILTFLQCQLITVCRGILNSNKVHIIFPCFGVDNFRQFCVMPIARLSIVQSLCRHFQTGYVSRLPVPSTLTVWSCPMCPVMFYGNYQGTAVGVSVSVNTTSAPSAEILHQQCLCWLLPSSPLTHPPPLVPSRWE